MRIQKGDTVIVTKGSDRKKTGTVLDIVRGGRVVGGAAGGAYRVVVSGVNVRTMHIKPRTRDEKGSIVKKERPISISNVAILDPKTKKPTRVSYVGTGKEKKRVTRKSNTTLAGVVKKSRHRTGVMTKADSGTAPTAPASGTAPTAAGTHTNA